MSDVRVLGIEKRYGSSVALAGIDTTFRAGLITVLLGPSGCGKTTLLRILAGLTEPDAGRVELGEEILNDPRARVPTERRHLGMVVQDALLWPHLRVRRNIAFPLGRVADAEARVLRAARAAHVEPFLDRYPAELSGGERQRVAIARAIVRDPRVLLLDEPLSGLDANLRVAVMDTIRDVQRALSVTTVYVTHDQEEALSLADRVVVMRNGRILQEGTPDEVYRNPRTEFVARFVGLSTLLPGQVGEGGLATTERGTFPAGNGTGGSVMFAVRPESVRLDGEGGIAGTVAGSRFLGGRWMVRVRVGAREVLCVSEGARAEGEEVRLRIDPAPAVVVPDVEAQ